MFVCMYDCMSSMYVCYSTLYKYVSSWNQEIDSKARGLNSQQYYKWMIFSNFFKQIFALIFVRAFNASFMNSTDTQM